MTFQNKLVVLSNLQRVALETEDTSLLIPNLLNHAINQLQLAEHPYQFIAVVFVDANKQIKQSAVVDINHKNSSQIQVETVINVSSLFAANNVWESNTQKSSVFAVTEFSELIVSSYPGISRVKCLLVSPIRILGVLAGVLIIGSPREEKEIDIEENKLVEVLTNIVAVNFKLSDAEKSLTNITQQVYEMNAKLHQLDKLKDDFVSVASHELRTPMTAIRSYAWMALYRSDIPLSEKLKKYLGRTLISTERLINLVNDMLNISRIEAGRIEINPQAVDVLALGRDILEEVTPKAQERNLHLSISGENMPKVFADLDKLRQVFLNLIGNSLKFTPPGGQISLSFFSDGQVVETSVTDTGQGISQDDVSKLFQKFGRLDNSYVAMGTSGGTGLGLYICKSLINLMHGKIWAASAGTGTGATFTFSLPIATQELIKEAEKYHIKPEGEAKVLEPVAI